jgi:Mn2+/Fe2+ NRAMP family transporter
VLAVGPAVVVATAAVDAVFVASAACSGGDWDRDADACRVVEDE